VAVSVVEKRPDEKNSVSSRTVSAETGAWDVASSSASSFDHSTANTTNYQYQRPKVFVLQDEGSVMNDEAGGRRHSVEYIYRTMLRKGGHAFTKSFEKLRGANDQSELRADTSNTAMEGDSAVGIVGGYVQDSGGVSETTQKAPQDLPSMSPPGDFVDVAMYISPAHRHSADIKKAKSMDLKGGIIEKVVGGVDANFSGDGRFGKRTKSISATYYQQPPPPVPKDDVYVMNEFEREHSEIRTRRQGTKSQKKLGVKRSFGQIIMEPFKNAIHETKNVPASVLNSTLSGVKGRTRAQTLSTYSSISKDPRPSSRNRLSLLYEDEHETPNQPYHQPRRSISMEDGLRSAAKRAQMGNIRSIPTMPRDINHLNSVRPSSVNPASQESSLLPHYQYQYPIDPRRRSHTISHSEREQYRRSKEYSSMAIHSKPRRKSAQVTSGETVRKGISLQNLLSRWGARPKEVISEPNRDDYDEVPARTYNSSMGHSREQPSQNLGYDGRHQILAGGRTSVGLLLRPGRQLVSEFGLSGENGTFDFKADHGAAGRTVLHHFTADDALAPSPVAKSPQRFEIKSDSSHFEVGNFPDLVYNPPLPVHEPTSIIRRDSAASSEDIWSRSSYSSSEFGDDTASERSLSTSLLREPLDGNHNPPRNAVQKIDQFSINVPHLSLENKLHMSAVTTNFVTRTPSPTHDTSGMSTPRAPLSSPIFQPASTTFNSPLPAISPPPSFNLTTLTPVSTTTSRSMVISTVEQLPHKLSMPQELNPLTSPNGPHAVAVTSTMSTFYLADDPLGLENTLSTLPDPNDTLPATPSPNSSALKIKVRSYETKSYADNLPIEAITPSRQHVLPSPPPPPPSEVLERTPSISSLQSSRLSESSSKFSFTPSFSNFDIETQEDLGLSLPITKRKRTRARPSKELLNEDPDNMDKVLYHELTVADMERAYDEYLEFGRDSSRMDRQLPIGDYQHQHEYHRHYERNRKEMVYGNISKGRESRAREEMYTSPPSTRKTEQHRNQQKQSRPSHHTYDHDASASTARRAKTTTAALRGNSTNHSSKGTNNRHHGESKKSGGTVTKTMLKVFWL
jgi:hypothetical protein